MKYALAEQHRPSLTVFAQSNVLLAFDFDGVLAPIAERPQSARMRTATKRLLARVSRCYPCVVISGRALADVARRVVGVPVWTVLGNHGIEPWGQQVDHVRRAREWARRLERTVSGYPGVAVEDKGYSITVHYRRARNKAAARRAIRTALVGIRGARVFPGKQAVNIVPRTAPHKGVALEQARRLVACDRAIYVGDDHTDEDAFGAAPADRLLSIRIGRARRTRATYYLRNQRDIDGLLQTLIALRSDGTGVGPRAGERS